MSQPATIKSNYDSDLKALEAVSAKINTPDFVGSLGDLEVDVWYDYSPEENDTNSGESIDIGAIEFNGTDITESVRNDTRNITGRDTCKVTLWDDMESQCWEHVSNRGWEHVSNRASAREDYGDYLYEQKRDREMDERS